MMEKIHLPTGPWLSKWRHRRKKYGSHPFGMGKPWPIESIVPHFNVETIVKDDMEGEGKV